MTTSTMDTTRPAEQDHDQVITLWEGWQRSGAQHLTMADAAKVIERRHTQQHPPVKTRYDGPADRVR